MHKPKSSLTDYKSINCLVCLCTLNNFHKIIIIIYKNNFSYIVLMLA